MFRFAAGLVALMREEFMRVRTLVIALALVCAPGARAGAQMLPAVVPNENRVPGGMLRDGVLTIRLVATWGRWAPEGESGRAVDVIAFAEDGRAPQIPAPLIRVPVGTVVEASVRNALPDSTLWVFGLATRPMAAPDSVAIPAGESRVLRFEAGAPGTYLYRAKAGSVDWDVREREQLLGALVVDPAGAAQDDRIFVINIWGEPVDSTGYENALTVNGMSWPHTEALTASVGDTLRWRVINGSVRNHPMHLHGFYFRVDARGNERADTIYPPESRPLAVTEDLSPAQTMAMTWTPDRPGNWLFHCHITFHVVDHARLSPRASHSAHSSDPREHMAGLVLGIQVREHPAGVTPDASAAVRRLRLFVNEGERRHRAERALGFVLQRSATAPAPDSVEIPGSVLVLERGEPTEITILNRLRESAAVHWHGIELESYSDGVPGWSGALRRLAPAVMPGDSFVARLTLPRAGTFIYHTHLNDLEQITSGLYGAIVVLEPGQPWDPASDHVFVAGWDGRGEPPRILVNGDSLPAPQTFAAGVAHRLRFVNIGPATRLVFELRRGGARAVWQPLAKDGADLPPALTAPGAAARRLAVGETFDALFTPETGDYELIVRLPPAASEPIYRLKIRAVPRP